MQTLSILLATACTVALAVYLHRREEAPGNPLVDRLQQFAVRQWLPLVVPVLTPQGTGQRWSMSYITVDRPRSDEVFLRGKLDEWGNVRRGIESLTAPDDRSKEQQYQDAAERNRLFAELVVQPDGQAALKQLHIE